MTEAEKFDVLMYEYEEDMIRFQKKRDQINNRIFNAIENQLGKKYLLAVKDCLTECEADFNLSLVKKPIYVDQQEEDWEEFNHIFVDQYENGGFSGDDFAGYIYIPLKENLYLKSHYSM